jgi:hypothetical protein
VNACIIYVVPHTICNRWHLSSKHAPSMQAQSPLKEDPSPSPSRTSFYLRSARDCAPFYKNAEFSGSTSPLVGSISKANKDHETTSYWNQIKSAAAQLNGPVGWLVWLVDWAGLGVVCP